MDKKIRFTLLKVDNSIDLIPLNILSDKVQLRIYSKSNLSSGFKYFKQENKVKHTLGK